MVVPSSIGVGWLDKGLDDVPDVFGRIAEFAARNAGTQTEVTDTDRVVFECICEIIGALGHCANEYTDTLLRPKV